MGPTAPLWKQWFSHPTHTPSVLPDVPVGEKRVQNGLSLELDYVLHIKTHFFFLHSLTKMESPRHAATANIEERLSFVPSRGLTKSVRCSRHIFPRRKAVRGI